jgi:hypothetical protein
LPGAGSSGTVAAMRLSHRVVLGLLATAAALSTACVTVRPHQREHLSKPEMLAETELDEEAFHGHVEAAREAGMGGHGAAGGGCGCG